MKRFNPLNHSVCFEYPELLLESAWLSHIPFGMMLVDLVRPSMIVELGTHSGVSYASFCQAVKFLGLETKCYAVDTWKGDPHSGFYNPDILKELRQHHDPRYGHFSSLIVSTFDDAVTHFEDGSIDLLHIDGYHTYENVQHDFDTWLPKTSPQAVILVHDTNVRHKDFGAHRLWDKVKEQFPSFEFVHGFGLGVLGVGEDLPQAIKPLFSASLEETNLLRSFFFAMGRQYDLEVNYKLSTIKMLKDHAAELEYKDRIIADLESSIAGRHRGKTPSSRMAGYPTAQSIRLLEIELGREDRVEKILCKINPKVDRGLEIGPLTKPIVEKEKFADRILYVDHAPTAELREVFRDEPLVDEESIVEVDLVWRQRSLLEINKNSLVDYVVASHVIEHVPDMIGWLQELSDVLVDGGILSLAIPDKRYTFDIARELTSLGELVQRHLLQAKTPQPGEVFDHFAFASHVDPIKAWKGSLEPRTFGRMYSLEHAYRKAREVTMDQVYHDVHVSVFTPERFLNLLEAISMLGFCDFTVDAFFDTQPGEIEFFMTLKRLGRGIDPESSLKDQLDSIDAARNLLF